VTIPASVTSIGASAFGVSLFTYYIRTRRAGTYEYRNNQWYHNGTELTNHPAILRLGPNAWLVSIDGKSPDSFGKEDLFESTKAGITKAMNSGSYTFTWPSNFPARITSFWGGAVYLPPGTHTIEVIYLAATATGISYSTDSMLWEQRYLFEGYTYELTATPTPDGRQINFGIKRQ